MMADQNIRMRKKLASDSLCARSPTPADEDDLWKATKITLDDQLRKEEMEIKRLVLPFGDFETGLARASELYKRAFHCNTAHLLMQEMKFT